MRLAASILSFSLAASAIGGVKAEVDGGGSPHPELCEAYALGRLPRKDTRWVSRTLKSRQRQLILTRFGLVGLVDSTQPVTPIFERTWAVEQKSGSFNWSAWRQVKDSTSLHYDYTKHIAMFPNANVAATKDGEAKLYWGTGSERSSFRLAATHGVRSELLSLEALPGSYRDGIARIAAVVVPRGRYSDDPSGNAELIVWDVEGNKEVSRIDLGMKAGVGRTSFVVSPDGNRALIENGFQVAIVNLATGAIESAYFPSDLDDRTTLAVTDSGEMVTVEGKYSTKGITRWAFSDKDGAKRFVRVSEVDTHFGYKGPAKQTWLTLGPKGDSAAVVFSSDQSAEVVVYDVESGRGVGRIGVPLTRRIAHTRAGSGVEQGLTSAETGKIVDVITATGGKQILVVVQFGSDEGDREALLLDLSESFSSYYPSW